MAMTSLTKARLRKSTLIVLVVTVVSFVAALIIRESDNGSSLLLTIIYQGLGAVAGLGVAFVVVFVPLFSWQESRKNRRNDDHPG
jgi:cell division protein FtsW (lipid II flippase)